MDFKLLEEILDNARADAAPWYDMQIQNLLLDVRTLNRVLSARSIPLEELEHHIAPDGLLDAVQQLYQACGDEGSEEADALAELPSDLNEAIADVIRYGSDL